ncbi:hypothetical protein AHAS_Ahas13G0154800 [Arachis hypogaea]
MVMKAKNKSVQQGPPERHIHIIAGGFAGRRVINSSHKRHLKELYHVVKNEGMHDLPTTTFTKEDVKSVIPGHDNPVVITLILANANLHMTLVD